MYQNKIEQEDSEPALFQVISHNQLEMRVSLLVQKTQSLYNKSSAPTLMSDHKLVIFKVLYNIPYHTIIE